MNQGNNTAASPDIAAHRYRPVSIGNPGVEVRRDGEFWYLRSREALGDFPERYLTIFKG